MASIPSNNHNDKKKKKSHKLSDLKTLGLQLLSSRAHINNLPLLLTYVSPSSPPPYVLEALLSLQSFFITNLPSLPSSSFKPAAAGDDVQVDAEFIYRTWLRSKFDELVKSLIDVAVSSECDDTLKEIVLDAIMEFVKVGNKGKFHSAVYHRFLQSIAHSLTPVDTLIALLVKKYFNHLDVRYFTYISIKELAKTFKAEYMSGDRNVRINGDDGGHSREGVEFIHIVHSILSSIPPLENSNESDYTMWVESGDDNNALSDNQEAKQLKMKKNDEEIVRRMKLKFSKAWISFLKLPLPIDVYKEVLVILDQEVIPYLSKPIILCDFLIKSYDIGGVISVMALSSLFLLMTKYGLEYPNFYEKLYALLVPSIFMAKHRAKFFQLLDSCLKSPLLPAYLAAAFAKKLSRLSLVVPPSGALVIIALIHNLLRRHPSINCLVHRENVSESKNDDSKSEEVVKGADASEVDADTPNMKPGIDHFNYEETDPIKSSALRSSLWEIDSLRHHYCPPVSRLVLSLENDLTVRSKTTEIDVKDFVAGSYSTILGQELKKKLKRVPLAFYQTPPTTLFSESDFAGWSFNHEHSEKNIDGSDHLSAKRQRIGSS
ncbi:protein NUCLEOLAR COMPLEX ASSOCIATED 4 isoform X2 [Benincasa hispida]|uniref:protein NUCLEOLAR COMPLEX ASSOCIATED 4 isoform X2 n=1 Tax=Benincasa hispida TaxID=102211 RepID=UPI0018FF8241|nr:protein NUCLEOLAR COMPLEX ASSOCIATED 4 isoform X2 [Benincasa hispida]